MSLLSNLRPNKGATKKRKVLGRGDASGHGGTSGKGHKGQKARSGGKVRWGFEGGQTPLMRRLPKVGFTNSFFKTRYKIVSLDMLESWKGDFNIESLLKTGWLQENQFVKVLANGSIKKSVSIQVHKISEKAKLAIEKAGGKVEVVG